MKYQSQKSCQLHLYPIFTGVKQENHIHKRSGIFCYTVLFLSFWRGFKANVDCLACMFCHLHTMDSSDSSLVQHLPTSARPAWQLSHLIHILAHVYSHLILARNLLTIDNFCCPQTKLPEGNVFSSVRLSQESSPLYRTLSPVPPLYKARPP